MISEARQKKINSTFRELLKACEAFATAEDVKIINKAYELAYQAELIKYKKESNINIMHSLEIALIAVNEIGLSSVSVVSLLLHNLLEADEITLKEIDKGFGSTVTTIVKGFFEVSNIQTGKLSAQSENFRKLFLTIVEDIRVNTFKISSSSLRYAQFRKVIGCKTRNLFG